MGSPISTQCQWQVQFGRRSCRSVHLGDGGGRRSVSFGGGRSSSACLLRPPRTVEATAKQNHNLDLSLIPPLHSLSSPTSSLLLVPVIKKLGENKDLLYHYPYCFVSLADNKIYKPSQRRLPWDDEFFFPDGTEFCGSSSEGWVLIKHPQTQQMYLVNPLFPSESVLALPLIYTFELDFVGGSVVKSSHLSSPVLKTQFICARDAYDYLPPETKSWRFSHRRRSLEFYPEFAMSSAPSDPTCTVLMQYFGDLGFWKPGQVYWTRMKHPVSTYSKRLYYSGSSVVYSGIHQCFFVLDSGGNVNAWKWESDSPEPQMTNHLEVTLPRSSPDGDIECERYADTLRSKKWTRDSVYLVESSGGDLLRVGFFSLKNEKDTNEFERVFVFKLNFEERKWEHVKSLGDSSLFMGSHYALCARIGDDSELRPNCIYFVGDLTSDKGVVYNMSDATIHPYTFSSNENGPSVWLLPNPNSA